MKNELIKALKKINNEGIMCYNMMIYGLKENDCVVLGELAYQIAKEVRDSKTNNVKIGYYLLDGYPTLE